eukprot:8560693-Alexandrium_andersonii.AAC.1
MLTYRLVVHVASAAVTGEEGHAHARRPPTAHVALAVTSGAPAGGPAGACVRLSPYLPPGAAATNESSLPC